jgi:Tfp pilus assembly protein PilX
MRRAAASEQGNVIVVAMFLLSIMLAMGLAAMSRVDTQSKQSGTERVRESTFNLSEAALSSQIFVLGRRGTGTASKQYPVVCPTAGNEFCPDPAKVALNYDQASQKDFDPSKTTWKTWVRDNATTTGADPDTFWQDSLLASRPRYDQNADRLMWVRAEATVRGRKRAMVGLIRIEDRPVTFPSYAILAGKFRTTNNGKHSDAIVDATGSLGVQVRCTTTSPYSSSNGCLEYKPSQGQIQPEGLVATGYQGPSTAISEDDLDALMDVARANGTYYTSCPGSIAGDVVVIDTTASCAYQGNTTYNSPSNPGLLILTKGKIEFRGTVNYYGLLYHANLDNSSAWDLVKIHGNSQLLGGAIVDGNGGIESGSSGKQNLKFQVNAFQNITSFGTAGVVQNTWREIKPLAG